MRLRASWIGAGWSLESTILIVAELITGRNADFGGCRRSLGAACTHGTDASLIKKPVRSVVTLRATIRTFSHVLGAANNRFWRTPRDTALALWSKASLIERAIKIIVALRATSVWIAVNFHRPGLLRRWHIEWGRLKFHTLPRKGYPEGALHSRRESGSGD